MSKQTYVSASLLLLLAACGQGSTKEEAKGTNVSSSTAIGLASDDSKKDDLTAEQKAVAAEMNTLVMDRAIVQRLTDQCDDVAINEPKMNQERQRLSQIAQTRFASQDAFLVAAGRDKSEEMGEKARRFFAERGVEWNSPRSDYCRLATEIISSKSRVANYLLPSK